MVLALLFAAGLVFTLVRPAILFGGKKGAAHEAEARPNSHPAKVAAAPQPTSRPAIQTVLALTETNVTPSAQKPATEADPEAVVNLLAEGNESLHQGKLAEAIAKYNEALRLNPDDEDTHFNLAIALARAGRNEEAKQHYEEALRILPDYAEVHNNLGNLLLKENKFAEALAHFEAALKSMPEHASAHNNLGTALGHQGKINEAIPHFAEAIRIQPNYLEARVNLGNAYLLQGRVNEAMAESLEVLRLQPSFEPASRLLDKARQKASAVGTVPLRP
ncbi:MAG: tetratricopeptide repeat protein [Verrucomicrobiota bacterium]